MPETWDRSSWGLNPVVPRTPTPLPAGPQPTDYAWGSSRAWNPSLRPAPEEAFRSTTAVTPDKREYPSLPPLNVNLPGDGAQALRELAGASELAQPFVVATGAQVSASSTLMFAAFNPLGSFEGMVIGFGFWLESEDYQTSPVVIARAGADQLNNNSDTAGDPVRGLRFTAPVAEGRSGVLYFPRGIGVPFKKNQAIGLQTRNGESSAIYAEGILVGLYWPAAAVARKE